MLSKVKTWMNIKTTTITYGFKKAGIATIETEADDQEASTPQIFTQTVSPSS